MTSDKITWTPEYIDWLREQYRDLTPAQIAPRFQARFGIPMTAAKIRSTVRRFRITAQGRRPGRFERGHTPWNSGRGGYTTAENPGKFQPGHVPINRLPLWSERICQDDYIEISVPEKNPYTGASTRFVKKHIWIWEQTHGRKKPAGKVVFFKDCNNRNFDPDNLILLSRTELLVLSLHDYKNQPDALKPSILALAKIEAAAGFRTRPWRKEKGNTNEV